MSSESDPESSGDSETGVRVFLSYAWEDEDYRTWIEGLATSLRRDGIDARIDSWHREEGQDLNSFMNVQVREADRFLVVGSPAYRRKVHEHEAGTSTSGVGWESKLFAGEFAAGNRHKFKFALGRGGQAESLPSWMENEFFYDLAGPEAQRAYEELVRDLLGQRRLPPPVGDPPEFSDGTVQPTFERPGPVPGEASSVSPDVGPGNAKPAATASPVRGGSRRIGLGAAAGLLGLLGLALLIVWARSERKQTDCSASWDAVIEDLVDDRIGVAEGATTSNALGLVLCLLDALEPARGTELEDGAVRYESPGGSGAPSVHVLHHAVEDDGLLRFEIVASWAVDSGVLPGLGTVEALREFKAFLSFSAAGDPRRITVLMQDKFQQDDRSRARIRSQPEGVIVGGSLESTQGSYVWRPIRITIEEDREGGPGTWTTSLEEQFPATEILDDSRLNTVRERLLTIIGAR